MKNTMKTKLLSLFLVLMTLVSAVCIPVSALEADSNYEEIMPMNAARCNPYNMTEHCDWNYIQNRNWNHIRILDALDNGIKGTSVNKANNEPCDVYCYPGTSYYVVLERKTRNLIQLSEYGNDGWIPDSTITWF